MCDMLGGRYIDSVYELWILILNRYDSYNVNLCIFSREVYRKGSNLRWGYSYNSGAACNQEETA